MIRCDVIIGTIICLHVGGTLFSKVQGGNFLLQAAECQPEWIAVLDED